MFDQCHPWNRWIQKPRFHQVYGLADNEGSFSSNHLLITLEQVASRKAVGNNHYALPPYRQTSTRNSTEAIMASVELLLLVLSRVTICMGSFSMERNEEQVYILAHTFQACYMEQYTPLSENYFRLYSVRYMYIVILPI